MRLTPKDEQRFWGKVDKTPGQGPNGDCWCWTGQLIELPNGRKTYPRGFGMGGKSYRPSHVAMTLDGRPRPSPDMEGLHSCDHPPCVRPSHLRWGTGAENRREYSERRTDCLDAETVRAIRQSTARPFEIARRFGLSQSHVHNIRNQKLYKHVA